MSLKGGVYKIENTKTGECYIGGTVNFKRRCYRHRSMLKNNKHYNKNLQKSWNNYGEDNFKFLLIEEINHNEPEKIALREKEYIDNTENTFNIYSHIDNLRGLPRTQEWKEKLSKMYSGEGNPFYGKHEENPMYG